jgi:hypothetical protein
MVPTLDWQEELVHILVDAGTVGLTQYQIIKRFDHWILAGQLLNELEILRLQNKVQRFRVPTKGRPAIYWRATNLILRV